MSKLEEKLGGKGRKTALVLLIAAVVGVILYFLPLEGLTNEAKSYLAVFAFFVIIVSTEVVSLHVGILLMMFGFVFFKVVPWSTAFNQYGTETVWLGFAVVGFANAILGTGLFKRIALNVVRLLPNNYRGQVTALSLGGLILGPTVPASQAKTVLMGAIAVSMSEQSGYEKNSRQNKGLFNAFFNPCLLVSLAFFSGSIVIPVLMGLMPEHTFSYVEWTMATVVFSLSLWVLNWLVSLFIYAPKKGELGSEIAGGENPAVGMLREMGPMSKNEKISLVILIVTILLWVTQSFHGLSTTMVAMVALLALTLVNIFQSGDYIGKIPWTIFIICGGVLCLSSLMTTTGLTAWISGHLAPILGPMASNPLLLILMVSVVTIALRFFIYSQMAAVIVVNAIFTAVAGTHGISAMLVVFTSYAVTTATFQLPFNNTSFIITNAITEKIIEHKYVRSVSYIACITTTLACLINVPVWMALGYA